MQFALSVLIFLDVLWLTVVVYAETCTCIAVGCGIESVSQSQGEFVHEFAKVQVFLFIYFLKFSRD